GLAALTAALAHRIYELYDAGEPLVEYPSELIDDNKVRAALRGMDSRLIDFWRGEQVAAEDMAHGLLEELAGDAAAIGCAAVLERRGAGLTARETRRARRRRRAAERRARGPRLAFATGRPYVTIAAILAPAFLLIVLRSADVSAYDLGAVLGAPGFAIPWWHY